MDMIFLGGGSTKTDSDGGTDFNIARSLYGTKANGELTYTNMTRYIIGDFPSNEDFPPINVLEIEPSGAYKYKTYENAKKIVSYLGYDTSKMTTENWTDYVKITSVASN